MKYCFYRMTVDSGFAPNPYHGYCTLAACTPNHQGARLNPGDVIVGVEANDLIDRRRKQKGESSTRQRCLIYYMKISEVVDLNRYFNGGRFNAKKPDARSRSYVKRRGDNAYFMNSKGQWDWIPGHDHTDKGRITEEIKKDIKGNRVFISNEFYYFGDKELPFPKEFERYLPPTQGIKYFPSGLSVLDEYVANASKRFRKKGRIGNPISAHIQTKCKT